MRVAIEAEPGELHDKAGDLARALSGICEREGIPPDALLHAFAAGAGLDLVKAHAHAGTAGAPSRAMQQLNGEFVAWYTDTVLPSMIAKILEILP